MKIGNDFIGIYKDKYLEDLGYYISMYIFPFKINLYGDHLNGHGIEFQLYRFIINFCMRIDSEF